MMMMMMMIARAASNACLRVPGPATRHFPCISIHCVLTVPHFPDQETWGTERLGNCRVASGFGGLEVCQSGPRAWAPDCLIVKTAAMGKVLGPLSVVGPSMVRLRRGLRFNGDAFIAGTTCSSRYRVCLFKHLEFKRHLVVEIFCSVARTSLLPSREQPESAWPLSSYSLGFLLWTQLRRQKMVANVYPHTECPQTSGLKVNAFLSTLLLLTVTIPLCCHGSCSEDHGRVFPYTDQVRACGLGLADKSAWTLEQLPASWEPLPLISEYLLDDLWLN